MVICVAQKIGLIKASLIHWNGTTGEDLRRARGGRPSIGWHDPWRAELCDLKQVFPRSLGGSPIHRLLTKASVLNDRNLSRSLPEKVGGNSRLMSRVPASSGCNECLPARDASAGVL